MKAIELKVVPKGFTTDIPFDMSRIPIDVLDKLYVSYTDTFIRHEEEDTAEDAINEHKMLQENEQEDTDVLVYPYADVVKHMLDLYPQMSDSQFEPVTINDITSISISNTADFWIQPVRALVPEININMAIFKVEMERMGYIQVRRKKLKDERGRDWLSILYNPNPKYAENIREYLSMYRLYHYSPETNRDDILADGLIPRNSKRTYDYPDDRVFFYMSYNRFRFNKSYLKMMADISSKVRKNDPYFSGFFDLYELDIQKLPDDVKIFYDPNAEQCVYLNVHIEPDMLIWHKNMSRMF